MFKIQETWQVQTLIDSGSIYQLSGLERAKLARSLRLAIERAERERAAAYAVILKAHAIYDKLCKIG